MIRAMLAVMSIVQTPVPIGDEFAVSIAAGHDVDGDGVPDLAIVDETPSVRTDVWLVSGRDGSILRRHEVDVPLGTVRAEFLGDVDCDQRPDLALGVHRMGDGWIQIVSAADGRLLHTLTKAELGLVPGWSVRAAGDLDGDERTDLLAFATSLEGMMAKPDQLVLAISATDGAILWRIHGSASSGMPTTEFTAIGDVDGDHRSDVAVCHAIAGKSRRVVVYSGSTGQPLHSIDGESVEEDFGHSLDGGQDFDEDGRPDMLIGSPERDPTIGHPGWVRVYSGHDGVLLQAVEKSTRPRRDLIGCDAFGECVRFLRDTDGDGVPELLVGSPQEGLVEGTAYLLSGATGSDLHTVEGRMVSDAGWECALDDYHTGREVDPAGDLDGDGIEDFVVANVPYDRQQCGRVRVLSGDCGEVLFDLDRSRLETSDRIPKRRR